MLLATGEWRCCAFLAFLGARFAGRRCGLPGLSMGRLERLNLDSLMLTWKATSEITMQYMSMYDHFPSVSNQRTTAFRRPGRTSHAGVHQRRSATPSLT